MLAVCAARWRQQDADDHAAVAGGAQRRRDAGESELRAARAHRRARRRLQEDRVGRDRAAQGAASSVRGT